MTITMETLRKIHDSLPGVEWMNVENAIAQRAWSLVAPAGDWKAAVDARVEPFRLEAVGISPEVVAWAISYMTATPADVSTDEMGRLRFQAVGYRMGPAGP